MLALYSPFFAAVSVGIAEFKAARFRVGIPGVFLLFSIPSLIGIYTLRLNGPSDEVSEYIRNRGNTDDIVVHFDELTASPLAVLLHEKQHVVYLPQSSSSYFNFKVYSKNLTVTDDIESYMNGKKNIWLVSRSPSPNHEAYIKTMKYLGFKQSIIKTKDTSDLAANFRINNSWLVINLERIDQGTLIPLEEITIEY